MPLALSQYCHAIVISPTPLRSGYGSEGHGITHLAIGDPVTITGEVWDMGCNHWMVVPSDQQPAFIHGNTLLNL